MGWTAIIFIGNIFTMVFGLLNLMTAVIVDSAAQARQNDVITLAKRKDAERESAWQYFNALAHELDVSKTGRISIEELELGLENIPELPAIPTIMGVEVDDLCAV